MRYKPRSTAALAIALGGLPKSMRVDVDSNVQVAARLSVGVSPNQANFNVHFAISCRSAIQADRPPGSSSTKTAAASACGYESDEGRTSRVAPTFGQPVDDGCWLRFCELFHAEVQRPNSARESAFKEVT